AFGSELDVSDNATLTIGPGVLIHGVSAFIGSFRGGQLLNRGTIAADGGGTITVQGIANFAAGTLTGGAWQVSGDSTLQLIGANLVTNAEDILRDGLNARLLSDRGITNALAGFATNTAPGRGHALHGPTLRTRASVSDRGLNT